MLSLLLTVGTATPPDAAAWRPIRTLLENWQFTTEYANSPSAFSAQPLAFSRVRFISSRNPRLYEIMEKSMICT